MMAEMMTPLAYIEIVVDTEYSVLAMFTFRVSNIDKATTRISFLSMVIDQQEVPSGMRIPS